MATRSTISIINPDGTIESIYCHWDGYIKGVGSKLINCYTTEKKVRKLLEKGDLSSIEIDDNKKKPEIMKCGNKKRTFNTIDELKKFEQDYNYLFNPIEEIWYVKSYHFHPIYYFVPVKCVMPND